MKLLSAVGSQVGTYKYSSILQVKARRWCRISDNTFGSCGLRPLSREKAIKIYLTKIKKASDTLKVFFLLLMRGAEGGRWKVCVFFFEHLLLLIEYIILDLIFITTRIKTASPYFFCPGCFSARGLNPGHVSISEIKEILFMTRCEWSGGGGFGGSAWRRCIWRWRLKRRRKVKVERWA